MDFTGLQKMAASKLSSVVPDQDSSRKGPSLGDAMEQLGAFGGSRIGGMARQAGALKSAAIGSAGGGALAGMLSSAEMSLDATTGMAAAGAKVGIEDLQASAVGLTSGGGGGINVPGMSPRLVGLAAVGLAGAAATHLMMSSASPGGNRRSLSTASSPYAGDGSRRLSLQDVDGGDEDGNLVPLTPGGHPMSMDTLKRSTESKSIKIGRYRFTDPTNKKERSKPYIYVPSALLENPSFSFEEVFELLGLEVPAIIFRVNSAQDSRHWNVRLPPGRVEELHNLYDDAHNRPPRHKLHPRQTVNDDGGDADEEVRNNGMGGGDGAASPSSSSPLRRRASMSVKVSRAAVSPAPPSGPESTPGAVRSPPSGMPDIEAGFGITAPLPAGRDRDASSGLKHYQGVLREKCRRLLKGTYAACMQAGAMFRANELWSMPPADELLLAAEAGDESSDDDDDGNGNAVGDYERLRRLALKYDKDAVAEWLTDEGKDINVKLLGIADVTAFNTEITTMLLHNVTSGHDRPKGDDAADDRDIKVPECILPADLVAQIKSGEVAMFKDQIVPGKMIGSFPHERLTHLIITDDQSIFDAKLQEIIPWGLMLINGSITESFMTNDCIQNGRPLIAVKYTGGTADLAVGMLEKRSFFLGARKIDGTRMPNDCEVAYSTVMPQQGHLEKDWLFEFDAKHTRIAREMNVLLENWPDRFNTSSVFAVDMFLTSEDEVQDRITQTMAVVFESAYELGGNVSEQKRLTYAWRVRQKFVFNAFLFKLESDLLMIFITLLTMLSTISAVLYTWFGMTSNAGNSLFNSDEQQILAEMILLRANLLLPLLATILRGIYASVSPMLKYVALKNAAVQLESEIYCYRTKVGKYGSRKRSNDGSSSGPDKGKRASGGNGGKGDGGDKGGGGDRGKGGSESKGGGRGEGNGGNNPRRAFSSALDSIWGELAGSDVQNGSLRPPLDPNGALDEINARIRANRKEQDSYLTLLAHHKPKPDKKKGGKENAAEREEAEVEKQLEAYRERRMQEKMDFQRAEAIKKKAEDKRALRASQGLDDGAELGADVDENGDGIPDRDQQPSFLARICICLKPIVDYLMDLKRRTLLMKEIAMAAMPLIAVAVPKDDGLSPLSADHYVKIRLLPMAASYSKKAPGLAMTLHVSTVLGVVLSVASSALSTFDLSVFIPAALALSGAVTAWTSYQQIDLRLLQTNAALNQLNQLLVWWDGLTMIEKRVPSHKETLVKSTEACIQAQATIFSGGARKNDDDEDGDDDNKK